MVASFAVGAAPTEVLWHSTALREGVETWTAETGIACSEQLVPATLNQNRVDVRRPVREHLLTRDGPSYERNITPW